MELKATKRPAEKVLSLEGGGWGGLKGRGGLEGRAT